VELVQSVLDRINAIDEKIGSYITVLEEDALEQAKEVQERIDKGEAKSPLAGIPHGTKGQYLHQNVKTTCASKCWEVSYLPMMRRCRKNFTMKVRCFWKAYMDEFAMGRPLKILILKLHEIHGTLKGFREVPAEVRLLLLPPVCGICTGFRYGGSIRQPASFCGIVGMKPTYVRFRVLVWWLLHLPWTRLVR